MAEGVNEIPSVRLEPKGPMYFATQISGELMNQMARNAGLTPKELIKFTNAQANSKLIFGYDGTTIRESGEPYYYHTRAVTLILLAELGITDINQLVAAFLHDIVEDSPFFAAQNIPLGQTVYDHLKLQYGKIAAKIILAVSKQIPHKPKNQMNHRELVNYQASIYKKILDLYPEVRIEALRLKFADRVHNLRTMPETDDPKILARHQRKIDETRRFLQPLGTLLEPAAQELLSEAMEDKLRILTPNQLKNPIYKYAL